YPDDRSESRPFATAPALFSARHLRHASRIHIPETLTINSCVTCYLRLLRLRPEPDALPLVDLDRASRAASAASFSLALAGLPDFRPFPERSPLPLPRGSRLETSSASRSAFRRLGVLTSSRSILRSSRSTRTTRTRTSSPRRKLTAVRSPIR